MKIYVFAILSAFSAIAPSFVSAATAQQTAVRTFMNDTYPSLQSARTGPVPPNVLNNNHPAATKEELMQYPERLLDTMCHFKTIVPKMLECANDAELANCVKDKAGTKFDCKKVLKAELYVESNAKMRIDKALADYIDSDMSETKFNEFLKAEMTTYHDIVSPKGVAGWEEPVAKCPSSGSPIMMIIIIVIVMLVVVFVALAFLVYRKKSAKF